MLLCRGKLKNGSSKGLKNAAFVSIRPVANIVIRDDTLTPNQKLVVNNLIQSKVMIIQFQITFRCNKLKRAKTPAKL